MSFSGATAVPQQKHDLIPVGSNTRIAKNYAADATAHALCFDCGAHVIFT